MWWIVELSIQLILWSLIFGCYYSFNSTEDAHLAKCNCFSVFQSFNKVKSWFSYFKHSLLSFWQQQWNRSDMSELDRLNISNQNQRNWVKQGIKITLVDLTNAFDAASRNSLWKISKHLGQGFTTCTLEWYVVRAHETWNRGVQLPACHVKWMWIEPNAIFEKLNSKKRFRR